MTGTIAITDYGWYEFLLNQPNLDEVNFWTPSSHFAFKGQAGGPFFFKLKAEHRHAICGFAYVARYSALPDWLAWDTFGTKNGVPSLEALRERIGGLRDSIQYRSTGPINEIGCILLSQPVFFPREAWVDGPKDWSRHNLRYKYYDIDSGEGLRIWNECRLHATSEQVGSLVRQTTGVKEIAERYGTPVLVQPRLGQGTFRISVMEAYSRACAVTHEHSLPALEASHIKPYGADGPHEVSNGIFLRADIHKLFDKGYITITPEYKIEVSPRLKLDYDNGKTYYPLHGTRLVLPASKTDIPKQDYLKWHNEKKYLAA
jgi:putative restriction endonuclease